MVDRTLSTIRPVSLIGVAVLMATVAAATWLAPTSILLNVVAFLTLACGVVFVLVRQRDLAYWGLLAVLPLEATLVIEAGFSILPAFLLLGLQIGSIILAHERIRFDFPAVRILLGYLAIVALSLLYAFFVSPPLVDTTSAMAMRASTVRPVVQTMLLALNVIFFAIVIQQNKTEADVRRSLQIYLGIAAFLALLGCWQSLAVALDFPGKDFTQAFGAAADQNYRYGETRFYSALITGFAPRVTFRESLHFSNYLVSIVPLALTLMIYRERLPENWRLRFVPLLLLAGLAALFLTMSRSGWIAMLAALSFVAAFVPKRQVLSYAAIGAAMLLSVGGVLMSIGYFRFDLDLWELMAVRLDAGILESDPRVEYLNALWTTFRQYPVLGVGIGNYGEFGAAAVGIPTLLSAHSIFLNALVETGVLGFLALAAFVVHFFFKIIQAIRSSHELAAYPYLVGVGAGAFGMTLQYMTFGDRPSFYYLFLLAIGHALIACTDQKRIASDAATS